MAGTIVRMDRSTITVDGTNKYEIIATCDVKGTLPDTAIFLLEIQTRTDPRDDTLVRVVQIADTTVVNTDRDAVIGSGGTRWRSSTVLLQYSDIETANTAWKELSGRINTLVANVDTFLTEFETGVHNETIVYPTADQTTKDALIAAYLATRAAVTEATTARDAEQAECNNLKKDIDNTTLRLNDAIPDLDRYTLAQAQLTAYSSSLNSIQPSLTSIVGIIRTLNATSSATGAEIASIEAQLLSANAQLTAFSTTNAGVAFLLIGPIGTAVSILQSRVTTLTSQRSTLITQYNACTARVATLQATLDAARATRDAALASARVVCPDYVPPT